MVAGIKISFLHNGFFFFWLSLEILGMLSVSLLVHSNCLLYILNLFFAVYFACVFIQGRNLHADTQWSSCSHVTVSQHEVQSPLIPLTTPYEKSLYASMRHQRGSSSKSFIAHFSFHCQNLPYNSQILFWDNHLELYYKLERE